MGWRFQRRKGIFPGATLNFSKSGVSFTFGGPWFKTNFGPRGTRQTFTIPGAGWSHVTQQGWGTSATRVLTQRPAGRYDAAAIRRRWFELLAVVLGGSWLLAQAFPSRPNEYPYAASAAEVWSWLALMAISAFQAVRIVLTWTTPIPGSDVHDKPEPVFTGMDDGRIRTTIAGLDPIEFEMAVAGLLERMGLQVRTTPRSGDGGVDIIAVDPAPVTGGLIVVQCKHTDVVGSPVIRDLYGAMAHHGANKGIVVTSGRFTGDASAWAAGKPIELIDGQKLADLIDRHR